MILPNRKLSLATTVNWFALIVSGSCFVLSLVAISFWLGWGLALFIGVAWFATTMLFDAIPYLRRLDAEREAAQEACSKYGLPL